MQDIISSWITQKMYIRTKIFGSRNVRLDKYIESTQDRADGTQRMRVFFVALDILRYSLEIHGQRVIHGKQCFEIL